MGELIAISEARAVLKRLGMDRVPVDVTAIARQLGFEIKKNDKMMAGESGQLLVVGQQKYILVNSNDSEFRQRFTVLHEIAHAVLELPSNHGDVVTASALESYASRPKEEVLCDVFAAECLVPWHLLLPMTEAHSYTAETIAALSETFQASRSCVASRFAQASRDMLVYVLSEGGIIRYVASSQQTREHSYWIPIGAPLPRESAASSMRRRRSEWAEASGDGTTWSSSDCATSIACDEEAIYLERWDQTLSFITLEKVADLRPGNRRASDDDNERLPELTGVLPWPKR